MSEKLGAVIIDVLGEELTAEDRELLSHPIVGGVVLFARNFVSRNQLYQLCQQVRKARQHPLLIMVDQEGGRVQRFHQEFTRLPCLGSFGVIYDQDPSKACQAAEESGRLMASELLSIGIDLSLAPVLDLNKPVSNVIGDRAFHKDPDVVSKLAKHYMAGMKTAGMAATGKHFPGHGSIAIDSHTALPVDERSLSAVEQDDMRSFASLIEAGIPAIMAAHILFPSVDANCVGFSQFWLRDILRRRLGFNGAILSDDLNMEGANISSDHVDRITMAREAGCDFTLLCNNRPGVIRALDRLPQAKYQVECNKWRPLQGGSRQ